MEPIASRSPEKGRLVKKSPQELAAQLEAVVSTNVEFTRHPEGENLDMWYKTERARVLKLLEAGVDDDRLSEELGKLQEEGFQKGVYAPDQGPHVDGFLDAAKAEYMSWGTFKEDGAEREARERIKDQGYVAELRKWRQYQEKQIAEKFDSFIAASPLSPVEEQQRIEDLQRRCIDINTITPEQREALNRAFPGGNFLYHGTFVEQAIHIASSGEIVNAQTLYGREEERLKREGGEKSIIRRNSGYEGISWNFNTVEALPGDRYHLIGFLAAPTEVLNNENQLAIPSRPAPHELILINGNIDSKRFYEMKTQHELLLHISFGETNSVWSNIVQLSMYRENEATGKKNQFMDESMLEEFSRKDVKDVSDENLEKILREKYRLRENETIEFSVDLLQQAHNEIPVAAVWFQALIDTGRMKHVPGFEDVTTVREATWRIGKDNYKNFLPELRVEKSFVDTVIDEEEKKIESIAVPTDAMFLVVPRKDLRKWLRVLARCERQPRGVIAYDAQQVRLEHFAKLHRGDAGAMNHQVKSIIPPRGGHIDYEDQILRQRITVEKLAGHRHHVIGEKYLMNRKSMRKDEEGSLVIQ